MCRRTQLAIAVFCSVWLRRSVPWAVPDLTLRDTRMGVCGPAMLVILQERGSAG
ncbi:hypothetical protein ACFV2D_31965 [Streptomyces capillispiralis]|uniref:hypothetical protein n=1 Tax=Streptomyces capillispiralis TaxID=68182 RepID=UPI0036B13AE9